MLNSTRRLGVHRRQLYNLGHHRTRKHDLIRIFTCCPFATLELSVVHWNESMLTVPMLIIVCSVMPTRTSTFSGR